MTPYYEHAGITIYHGDCRDVLSTLGAVDLVVTSPPYNLGVTPGGNGRGMYSSGGMHAGSLAAKSLAGGYATHDDAMDPADYDEWQTAVVHDLWDHLTDTGAIFYNHKQRPIHGQVKLPLDYGSDLPLRQVITWDRATGMNFSASHFLPKSEWIILWAKPGWRLRDRKACEVGDVWRFPPEQKDDHPAPFPLGLPARCIQSCVPASVLDPFAGSGTTLVAAKAAGVPAVGIELSERYCEIAAKRLGQEVLDLGA